MSEVSADRQRDRHGKTNGNIFATFGYGCARKAQEGNANHHLVILELMCFCIPVRHHLCMQNFGGETCWKATTWGAGKKVR